MRGRSAGRGGHCVQQSQGGAGAASPGPPRATRAGPRVPGRLLLSRPYQALARHAQVFGCAHSKRVSPDAVLLNEDSAKLLILFYVNYQGDSN